jgi:hypothetical protein
MHMEYIKCHNTGKYKLCLDDYAYDKEWESLENTGLSLSQIHNLALDVAGYEIITPCPYCNKEPEYYREKKNNKKQV